MGNAKTRGTYEQRKANPKGKVVNLPLDFTTHQTGYDWTSRDERAKYIWNGVSFRRVNE